jgi:hypothetical protein
MLVLSDAADMAALIVRAEQLGLGYRVPIYRAAAAGLICLSECGRGGTLPSRLLKASPRPQLICIGDDDATPSGPAGWPQARKLLRWARGVVLHGAGGSAEHYTAAAVMAALNRRTLLVETDSAHLPAWIAVVRARKPVLSALVIAVPPGRAHPVECCPIGATIQ